MIFRTILMSSNFALSHASADGDAGVDTVTRLFPGMTAETAAVALELYRKGWGHLRRPSQDTIEVPDARCNPADLGEKT